jgi:hypothetical protein
LPRMVSANKCGCIYPSPAVTDTGIKTNRSVRIDAKTWLYISKVALASHMWSGELNAFFCTAAGVEGVALALAVDEMAISVE